MVSRRAGLSATAGHSCCEYLLVCGRDSIMCYLVEHNINKFSFINQIKFDHH